MHEDVATHERLAAIETRIANMESVHKTMMTAVAATNQQLTELHVDLAKYKGAWGTLVMVCTALWAVVALSKDWVLSHWK